MKHNITIYYGAGVRTVTRGGVNIDLNSLDRHEERALRAAIVSRFPRRRHVFGNKRKPR